MQESSTQPLLSLARSVARPGDLFLLEVRIHCHVFLFIYRLMKVMCWDGCECRSHSISTARKDVEDQQQQEAYTGVADQNVTEDGNPHGEEVHLTYIRSPVEPTEVSIFNTIDDEDEKVGGAPPPPFPRPFKSNPVTRPFNDFQEDPLGSVLDELEACTRLSCIIHVHDKIDGRTTFNFPHFFLLGYPFSGSRHIIDHLNKHSEFDGIISSSGSSWFNACQGEKGPEVDREGCNVSSEKDYIQNFLNAKRAAASGLEMVTVDTSTDYIFAGGPLARRLYRYFPWAKLVIVIRDPITRLLSKITRRHENGTVIQLCDHKRQTLGCMQDYMAPGMIDSNYSEALEGWLLTFPKEQIHVIQYEELLEAPDKVMFDLKYFLGANVAELVGQFSVKGVDFTQVTFRRGQYMRLMRAIEDDVDATLSLLQHHSLIGKRAWLSRWEAQWQKVLSSCDELDSCTVEGIDILPYDMKGPH